MTDFKQRIEEQQNDSDGADIQEFYDLIQGSEVNHTKILEGLADEETLKALKALFLKDHSNLSELIKATVLDGNKPAGLEWKYIKVNGSDTQEDFIDLCFLGWVMQNQEEDTSSFTEADFVAKAKEYYKNNIEKKEVIIQKDVAAEGINEVATTTVTRDRDGLSGIDNVSNIGLAEINVEAGASSTRMSESGAYELFSDNIDRLKEIKNSFKDPKAIDDLILELGGDKNSSELKKYKRITDIVGGRANQYGNAILILARLTEGFIQSLEKIEEKAIKDGDKAVVDLELNITRDKCKIGNNGEVDEDRYLNIYGKVEGVMSEEEVENGDDEDEAVTPIIPDDAEVLENTEVLKIGYWNDKTFTKEKKGDTPAGEVFGNFNVPAGDKHFVTINGTEIKNDHTDELNLDNGKVTFSWNNTICTATYIPTDFPVDSKTDNKDIIKISGDGLIEKEATMTLKTVEKVIDDGTDDLPEEIEVLEVTNGDPRRIPIAQAFGVGVDDVDETGDTRAIDGYQGLKFSKMEKGNPDTETGDRTVTFSLEKGTASKGWLQYDVIPEIITLTQHEDGRYDDIDESLTDNLTIKEVDKSKLGLPDYIEVTEVTDNDIKLKYANPNALEADKSLELIIPINKLTGKLKFPTASEGDLSRVKGEWLDVTPNSISEGIIFPKYNDSDPLKLYARVASDGKIEIITNLMDGHDKLDEAYGEIITTKEDYKEESKIFFSIYNSGKNESPEDKEMILSGISRPEKNEEGLIKRNEYIYEVVIPSNSGAEGYTVTIPYTVNRKDGKHINEFNENEIKIFKDGKELSPETKDYTEEDNTWNIDGVFYQISTEGNKISFGEHEAKGLGFHTEKHQEELGKEITDIDKEYTSTTENTTIPYTTIATTNLPTYNKREFIRNESGADEYSSGLQEISLGDDSFEIHYDENSDLTYITNKDGSGKWYPGDEQPSVTIENYLGVGDLILNLKTDVDGNVSIEPDYTNKESAFDKKADLAEKIYDDKQELYNMFGTENIRGILGDDLKYFQFPESSNTATTNIDLDEDRGKDPSGKPRFKGPDRKGVYTVVVIESENRWSNPDPKRSKKPNFELHFKRDTAGKMQLVDPDGNAVENGKIIMPLEHSSDSKLEMNYEFKVEDEKLIVVPKGKEELPPREFLASGDEVLISGEPQIIQEVLSSEGKRHKLLFSGGKIGTIWMEIIVTEKTPDGHKGYSTLEEVNTELENAEGKYLNTLFKDTLVQKIDDMEDVSGLGCDIKVLKSYISTLGPDLELLKAIAGLSKNAGKNFDFVPLVVDNHLEMGAVREGKTINNISEVPRWKLWDAKLEELITQISFLKKAEDIKLDYDHSDETTGIFMHSDAETFTSARETILSQGMTKDAVLTYKLSNGHDDPVDLKITMGVQTGDRFTVTNNPVDLGGYKYTLSYHRKTTKNKKEKANTITIDRAERLETPE